MAVAGMDALSYPCENILTRRANQRHYSIIAQFAKRPWPCPTTGPSSAIAGKKSLHTIEVAPARRSCIGSPQRRVASRVAEPRALFRCASPRRYRREHSSRPRQGNGTSTWNHKSVLQPILRDGHFVTGTHPSGRGPRACFFPGHALTRAPAPSRQLAGPLRISYARLQKKIQAGSET